MRKIIKYDIAFATDLIDIEDNIVEYIGNGYQPYGNLIVNNEQNEAKEEVVCYYQAMVKYAD